MRIVSHKHQASQVLPNKLSALPGLSLTADLTPDAITMNILAQLSSAVLKFHRRFPASPSQHLR